MDLNWALFFLSGSMKLYKFRTETYLGVFGDAKLVSDCYYTFISTKQTINYSVIIKSIHCTFFNRFFGGIRSTSARSRAAHSWLAFQKHPVHTRIKGRHRCPETTLNQTHRGNTPVSFARDIRQYSCVCFWRTARVTLLTMSHFKHGDNEKLADLETRQPFQNCVRCT